MGVSLLHDIGQLGGHALNALPGYSTLGSQITNPNVNYLGKQNPPTPSNNFYGAPAVKSISGNGTPPPATPLNTSSGGSGSPAVDPQTTALYNQNMGVINSALGRLPGELGIAQGNIQGQFNTNNNELDSADAAAKGQYNTSTTGNQQSFQTNKNQIQDQSSAGLTSLLRVLGAHGAGGSSAALYNAPNAVANVASQQNAGAGQTYGQNQQALDTNWGNYTNQYDNQKKQLNDWLSSQLSSAQSQSDQTKQGLLQQQAQLQPTAAAAQPFINQINSLAGQVDQLGKLSPTYNGTTPVYTAPDVSSYTVGSNQVQQNQPSGIGGTLTPALYSLLGLDKQKNNQLVPTA